MKSALSTVGFGFLALFLCSCQTSYYSITIHSTVVDSQQAPVTNQDAELCLSIHYLDKGSISNLGNQKCQYIRIDALGRFQTVFSTSTSEFVDFTDNFDPNKLELKAFLKVGDSSTTQILDPQELVYSGAELSYSGIASYTLRMKLDR